MSGTELALIISVFAACAVEAVETATIVLAIGLTRGWRSSLAGLAAGVAVLAVLIAALGPALDVVPLDTLRAVVGTLLLIFGLQWLRKAILRAAGRMALHDEDAELVRQESIALKEPASAASIDAYGFTIVFKGTLLEGLEVAFIALTFGSTAGNVGLAAAAAAAAVLVVGAAALLARQPLSQVPENPLKLGVGVMLVAFGAFWGAEGVGAEWPGGEWALALLIPTFLVVALALIAGVRRTQGSEVTPSPG